MVINKYLSGSAFLKLLEWLQLLTEFRNERTRSEKAKSYLKAQLLFGFAALNFSIRLDDQDLILRAFSFQLK